jgi:hypothetical protein
MVVRKSVMLWNRPWKNPLSPNGTMAHAIMLASFLGMELVP